MRLVVQTQRDLRQDSDGSWTYTALSGVTVRQDPRPYPDRWMDDPRWHIFWSYLSWTTQILSMLSYEAETLNRPRLAKALAHPRRALKARNWW